MSHDDEWVEDWPRRAKEMVLEPRYTLPTVSLALIPSFLTHRVVARLIPIPIIRHVVGAIVARYSFFIWVPLIGVVTIILPVFRRLRSEDANQSEQ